MEHDGASGREFGRRRYDVARPVMAQPSPFRQLPISSPPTDPEFEAWSKARNATRWRTWGICGLLVVGGPMSLLLPEGLGQFGGMGLCGLGLLSFVARFRKRPKDEL